MLNRKMMMDYPSDVCGMTTRSQKYPYLPLFRRLQRLSGYPMPKSLIGYFFEVVEQVAKFEEKIAHIICFAYFWTVYNPFR